MSKMYQLLSLMLQAVLIGDLHLYCCEGTSITLSPSGMVSVCPGGRVLLTCERMSGSFLFWDVSVPHLAGITTQERIILNQGVVLSPVFSIGFTEFNITRTSESPLISQLLITNVTTEINGSTVYCSEDGDENNAPMITINVKYRDDSLRSTDRSLNVTMADQLLRSDDVIVTLQWPREPGAVYHVSVSPEMSHNERTSMRYDIFAINLTISYNIQYNVSIVSSLCGVTTTRVLKYADCGSLPEDRNLKLNYSSTLEGSVLLLTCENEMSLNSTSLSVTCHSNGSWIPSPADFIQSCLPFSTTMSPTTGAETLLWTPVSSILITVCVVISIVFLSIGYACGWFSHKHKQSRTSTATSDSVEENSSHGAISNSRTFIRRITEIYSRTS